ncbi:MAG: hypothetical protein MOB07_23565 [Acidobacteria bacterium]|nr:hypothetical protein [Acidobacteriota bacterium]
MRTLIVITIGLILSVIFVFGASFINKSRGEQFINGAYVFIGLWLIICIVDFYFGVKAGYSALEELGIHLVVFGVPAAVAFLLSRKF